MDRTINLIDYLPPMLQQVHDLQRIFNAELPEVVGLWQAVDNAWNDQFVLEATENGVARWEHILGIIAKGTDSLDSRKFRILTRLNEQLPYTIRMLRQQLETLCGRDGYSIHVNLEQFILTVKINLIAKSSFAAVEDLLERIVPLNIVINLALIYNQHSTLGRHTHAWLSNHTHNQLRNEVLS